MPKHAEPELRAPEAMTGPLPHAIAAAMLEGLPPNNAAHLMRLACDEATARAIADIMVETFDPAETAAAAFEETTATTDGNSGPWVVEVYFGHAPEEAAIRALVAAVAGEAAASAAEFRRRRAARLGEECARRPAAGARRTLPRPWRP